MRARLGDLVVPLIVLIGTALYFFHVQEAPAVTRRVPNGVMLFILAMLAIVVARSLLDARTPDREQETGKTASDLRWRDAVRQIAFLALAVGYFLMFERLGFALTNFLFLIAAVPIAGFARGVKPLRAALPIGGLALVATSVFQALALVMEFNVPRGPLGF